MILLDALGPSAVLLTVAWIVVRIALALPRIVRWAIVVAPWLAFRVRTLVHRGPRRRRRRDGPYR